MKVICLCCCLYCCVCPSKVVKGDDDEFGYCHEDPLLSWRSCWLGKKSPKKGTKRQMAQEVLEMRRCRRYDMGQRVRRSLRTLEGDTQLEVPVVDWKGVSSPVLRRTFQGLVTPIFEVDDPRVVQKIQEQFPQININLS